MSISNIVAYKSCSICCLFLNSEECILICFAMSSKCTSFEDVVFYNMKYITNNNQCPRTLSIVGKNLITLKLLPLIAKISYSWHCLVPPHSQIYFMILNFKTDVCQCACEHQITHLLQKSPSETF